MNIIHLKYALEIVQRGSLNRAAENLHVAQPNLSRAIKDLEYELGITIFERSSKGMTLTPQGEEFMGYAKKILNEIEVVESMYKAGAPQKQSFSISVPRSSYIADAFSKFSKTLTNDPAEIYYNETNSQQAIKNILESNYRLGIIRYAQDYDLYFKQMLADKGLACEVVTEFEYVVVMSRENLLAKTDEIHYKDLENGIEITHGDPFVPTLPVSEARQHALTLNVQRRIYVFERGSQFCLLSQNPETFMWVSPLPDHVLKRYDLVQRTCPDSKRIYRDMLIYRKDYHFSALDKRFITELCESKRRWITKVREH